MPFKLGCLMFFLRTDVAYGILEGVITEMRGPLHLSSEGHMISTYGLIKGVYTRFPCCEFPIAILCFLEMSH